MFYSRVIMSFSDMCGDPFFKFNQNSATVDGIGLYVPAGILYIRITKEKQK